MGLGKRLREIRISSGLTLSEVAKRAEFTPGYISQIEREVTNPSIGALSRIAEALGVRRRVFFSDEDLSEGGSSSPAADGFIGLVKHKQRKALIYPGSNIRNELLCPDLQHRMEIVKVKAPVGVDSGEIQISHEGEECFIVQKGTVEFTLQGVSYILEAEDAIYFVSGSKHSWKNVGNEEAQIIWVRTPPGF